MNTVGTLYTNNPHVGISEEILPEAQAAATKTTSLFEPHVQHRVQISRGTVVLFDKSFSVQFQRSLPTVIDQGFDLLVDRWRCVPHPASYI